MLGMRRTLWVVPRDLVSVVDAACASSQLASGVGSGIRRRERGVERARAMDRRGRRGSHRALQARRGIHEDSPATTRCSRRSSVWAPRTRWEAEVSAASRILPLLAAEGAIVRGRPRGAWVNGQYRWVPIRTGWAATSTRATLPPHGTALLRRWLHPFGPATETDLRWWAGWTAREARAALAAVPHAVVDLGDGATGFVLADDLDPTERPEPWAALLPTLDPTTMGWKERDCTSARRVRSVRLERQRRPDRLVGRARRGRLVAAKDGEIVFELLEDVGHDAVLAVGGGSGAPHGMARRRPHLPRLPAAVPAGLAS